VSSKVETAGVRHAIALALLIGAAAAAPLASAVAAEAGASNADLDARLKVLERKLEIANEEAVAARTSAVTVTANETGFRLRSADQRFDLRIRGTVQLDYRSFLDDTPVSGSLNDTFLLRRVRPTFEFALGKAVALRLTPEFAGANATIVDAYLDLKVKPWLTFRAGKQKGPIGLERLQSGSQTVFIERALPTELAPNRDIGLTAQGDFARGVVAYQLGVYNGTADGRDANFSDIDDHKEYAARIFLEPFRNAPGLLQGFGVGVAASHGFKDSNTVGTNGALPQLRSSGQNTFFQYLTTVSASGDHDRWTAQSYYYRGGLGLIGEYIESEQEVRVGTGTTRAKLTNDAWQVTASYVLTGEDNSFRGVVKPNTAFGDGGWGAIEVALRASGLNVDDAAFPLFASPTASAREATIYAAGINWYVNANGKLSLNYSVTDFKGGATLAQGGDREKEKALFGRFQIAF
jgi:phosphate-selective porin OprO/OprP